MKATLEFQLPRDRAEFNMANGGAGFHSVLWDMDQWLRGKIKYGSEFKTVEDALDAARDYLRESMYDNGVKFEP